MEGGVEAGIYVSRFENHLAFAAELAQEKAEELSLAFCSMLMVLSED